MTKCLRMPLEGLEALKRPFGKIGKREDGRRVTNGGAAASRAGESLRLAQALCR